MIALLASRRAWIALALLCLGLFLPGIASLPPTDRDESRYVVTSERMADTGDVVDLRFQDQPRYLQPAGIYWLQAFSASVFDGPEHQDIWPYRIPSVLGALIAVLLTGWIGAHFFGRAAGLAAAVLLATSFSLTFEAHIAKIDAALLAAIVAAQLALMRAYVEPSVSRATSALFWAALGVGLMLKGPVILIVSGGTVLALLAWDRKAAWLRNLRPTWGPLVTLAVAAPWFIAIGVMTDGAFFTRALMRNFLGKVGAGEQGHNGPPGYHLALVLFAFWPGVLIAARALGFTWRERTQPAVRFLLCWIVPTWIVFELVATKLPHYVLPTYPALACLAAAGLFAPAPASENRWSKMAFALFACAWLAAGVVIAALAPAALQQMEGRLDPIACTLAAIGIAAAAGALFLLATKRAVGAVAAMAVAALAIWGNTFGYTLPRLESFWMSPRLASAARDAVPSCDGPLVTTPYSEPSLVFLYGRARTRLAATGAQAADSLAAFDCGVAIVGRAEQPSFLARAAALGVAPRPVAHINGRNYSNGDALDLIVYIDAKDHVLR